MAPSRRRDADVETLPKLLQLLPPSVEYCQLPFELSADVIATPVTPPGSSKSVADSALRKLETALPLLVVLSSRIAVKFAVVKELPLPLNSEEFVVLNSGAILTGVILMFIVSVAALNTLIPPFEEVLTLVPAPPELVVV